ncbi:hypothetical protein ACSBR2_019552 [Camellia fascicularis]
MNKNFKIFVYPSSSSPSPSPPCVTIRSEHSESAFKSTTKRTRSESMVSDAEMSILGVHHLSVPKTPILPIEKPFFSFSDSGSVVASAEFVPTIRSGSHTDKGHRQFNEDEHILIDHLSTQLPSLFLSPSPTSFYAVFDGHGGSNAASSYLKQNYTKLFFQEANFSQKPQELEDYHRKAFLSAAVESDSSTKPHRRSRSLSCFSLLLPDPPEFADAARGRFINHHKSR